ncbi:MAG TPA: hypothetical protein PLA16_03590, partial [Chitinophagales bacterium]|nr:hypothetical protein [Chitinophagales bacterium]
MKTKKNPIYEKYFVPAIMVKIFCAILLALIYQYYYKGGDTMTYFVYVQFLRELLYVDSHAFLNFVFSANPDDFMAKNHFGEGVAFFMNESSNIIIRMALILSYPLLNTYILVSFCFTLFCFYGCWKLFVMFREIYPHLEKQL